MGGKRKSPSEDSVKSSTKSSIKPSTKQPVKQQSSSDSSDSSDDEFTKPTFATSKSSNQTVNQSTTKSGEQSEDEDLSVHIVERPEGIEQHRSKQQSLLPESESSSDSDSDSDDQSAGPSIKINKQFAEKFEAEKRKAELSKKAQRGKKTSELLSIIQQVKQTGNQSNDQSDDDSDEDSDLEDEDDDGELLTKDIDQAISQTLNLIKAKDPRLYDPKIKFFDDASINQSDNQSSKSKSKSMSVKDAVLAGMDEQSDDDDDESMSSSNKLTFVQEQAKLKNDFLKNAAEVDEDDDLFMKKPKADGEGDESNNEEEDLFAVKIKSGEAIQPDEFLSAYLKNEWWKAKNPAKLPSYEAITGEAPPPLVEDEEDGAEYEQSEMFEQAYNFRFEEAGAGKIVTHPRQIIDTLRKTDTRRKEARERKKEKKDMEKLRVNEEIKKMKNQRLQELKEQAVKIANAAGLSNQSNDQSINIEDMEGDWDESAHEKLMAKLFSSDYYEQDIDDQNEDEFLEQIRREEAEDDRKYGHVDKSIKQSNAADPSINESINQTINQSIDQLYEMDYEDIIAGGLKTRFKYRSVQPNDYGLSINQLLESEDQFLNKKVSLKKLAPYADEYDQSNDQSNKWNKNSKFDQSKRFVQSSNRTNYQSNKQSNNQSNKPVKTNCHVIADDDQTIKQSKSSKPVKSNNEQSDKQSKPSIKQSNDQSIKPSTKPETVSETQSSEPSKSGPLTATQKRRLREKRRKSFNNQSNDQSNDQSDEPQAKRVKTDS